MWASSFFFPFPFLCTESIKADHTILKILHEIYFVIWLWCQGPSGRVKTEYREGTIRWCKELHPKFHVANFYPDSQYTAWDQQNTNIQVEDSWPAKLNSSCIGGKFSQVFWVYGLSRAEVQTIMTRTMWMSYLWMMTESSQCPFLSSITYSKNTVGRKGDNTTILYIMRMEVHRTKNQVVCWKSYLQKVVESGLEHRLYS